MVADAALGRLCFLQRSDRGGGATSDTVAGDLVTCRLGAVARDCQVLDGQKPATTSRSRVSGIETSIEPKPPRPPSNSVW